MELELESNIGSETGPCTKPSTVQTQVRQRSCRDRCRTWAMVTLHWLHKVALATGLILSPFPSHALQHFLTMGRVNSGYLEQESNFTHVFRLEPKVYKIVEMSYTFFFCA